MKLIHLTDPHLTIPGDTLYGLDPLERFNAAIDSINTLHADADLCVITGDLAHTAENTAYEALATALERLIPPCHFIMGNHDDRDKLKQRFPHLPLDKHGFVQTALPTPAGQFLLLDTIQQGSHRGAYCQKRQQWLREQLEISKGIDTFLFTHHPPFNVGIPTMDAIGIKKDDAKALATLLEDFDHVRHLFFGHLHRPLSGTWQGIGFSTLRSTCHQVWLDFIETEAIPGSHEPPAYAIVLIEKDQLVVHTHDFLDASEKYQLGSWRWEDRHKKSPSRSVG
jgi:3',5'-cyclic AMP phosphodiesterase CpdA